eukprot:g8313.t1
MFLGARRLGAVGSVASLGRFVRPRELLVGKDSVFVRFGRRFISGAVLERVHQSRAALQNAISMLEAGANPDTGQLFSSDQYAEFSRTISELQPLVNAYESYEECAVEIEGLDELIAEAEGDPELRNMAYDDKREAVAKMAEAEKNIITLLQAKDSDDNKNVILEVRSGAGGDESALFAMDLLRMYTRFSENKGWKLEPLSINETNDGGCSAAAVSIKGAGAFGRLKYESGVHRVQRVPATEKQGRIHTSTAAVLILPEATEVDIDIRKEDIRVDTMRASGAGGQHVNVTDSAVRLTHIPTNVVVYCADQRSQHKNKAKAMTVLRARLYDQEKQKLNAERQDLKTSTVKSLDRSERIRTYNFPQSRVTDHRVGYTINGGLDRFLSGDLVTVDGLMDQLQVDAQAKALEEYDVDA